MPWAACRHLAVSLPPSLPPGPGRILVGRQEVHKMGQQWELLGVFTRSVLPSGQSLSPLKPQPSDL